MKETMNERKLSIFFRVGLAGVPLDCAAHYADTVDWFGAYRLCEDAAPGGVRVSPEQWDYWQKTGKPCDAAAEFSMFAGACSDALTPHSRVLIHAAAFAFRGRAYLFAAAPSVGKSTQVRTLEELYPGEFSVICGDRPVLECRDDAAVLVHPSPWNGKEGWCGAPAAPLAGIFCLERGEETSLAQLSKKEAVLPVLRALISNFETEETIRALSGLEERIIRSAPVYRYVNGGVPDSTRFLYEHVFAKE